MASHMKVATISNFLLNIFYKKLKEISNFLFIKYLKYWQLYIIGKFIFNTIRLFEKFDTVYNISKNLVVLKNLFFQSNMNYWFFQKCEKLLKTRIYRKI